MQLEQLRQAVGVVLGKQELQLVWPIRIVLEKRNSAPTGFSLGRDAYMAALSENSGINPNQRKAIMKLLIEQNTKRLPPGIEEGLIALFSTLEVKGTRITLGAPVPQAERTREWGRMQLLTTDPAYAGRARVMFSNLEQGSDLDAAYRNAFEKNRAQIEKQLDGYLAAGTFGTTDVTGRALNPTRDFRVEDADSDEGKLAQADLLLAAGSPEAPANFNALHGPAAATGLGLIALKDHKTGEARQLFQSAIASPEAGARAWYEAGALEADNAKATADLTKAAQLNPRWAAPQYQLAQREADLDRKAILLGKAANLEPRNAEYWRELAETYMKANRFPEAQKAWGGAESAAANDQERQHIRQVRLDVEKQRTDFEESERKRIADEKAADLERVKNQSMAAIHAAEDAARKRLNPNGGPLPQPAQVLDTPEATARVEGALERLDCSGQQTRLRILKPDGKTALILLVRDTSQLILLNADKMPACGLQNPPRAVSIGYGPRIDRKLGTAGDVVSIEFR